MPTLLDGGLPQIPILGGVLGGSRPPNIPRGQPGGRGGIEALIGELLRNRPPIPSTPPITADPPVPPTPETPSTPDEGETPSTPHGPGVSPPISDPRARRNAAVSALSALQTGFSVLGQIAGLRNTFGSGPVRALYPESQGGTLTALPRLTLPQPGGGYTTGGRINGGSSMPLQGPPAGYHWAKDGSGRIVKNRHMNPLNGAAARRAIRRIKGARKMLQSIERQLPKRPCKCGPTRKR